MFTNTKFLKPLAWLPLVVTVYMAGTFAFSFGFMFLLMAFTQATVGDSPMNFKVILLLGAAIVIPAFFLIPFYLLRLRVTSIVCKVGWIASSIYHTLMTWLLVFHMPSTVEASHMPIPLPISIFTGTAVLVSIYALICVSSHPTKDPKVHQCDRH